jgi:DNA-binding response OmpR family regulator
MISFYCQICGRQFTTDDRAQRFCGLECRARFGRMGSNQNPQPVQSQARILGVLRGADGDWVARRALARAVYGHDAQSEIRALYTAIWRMRHTWGSAGLVIADRVERARHEGDAETYYRLVSDIASTAAAS